MKSLAKFTGLDVREVDAGRAVRFSVRVQSRASRNEIAGVHGSALKVRIMAPPVDGAANEALVSFLANELGVSVRAVTIVSGSHSSTKVIEIRE